MSINIPTHFVQQYATSIDLLLQQKGSLLRNAVMTGSHVGKAASPVDQVGAVNAVKRTTRYAPQGRTDTPTDRRWVYPVDYDVPPQMVDSFDKLRLINDPKSPFVETAVYALGRGMDDEIVTAFFGDAKTGETGATTTSFPAGQQVDVSVGGTTSGLNVAKLRNAKKILMANQVDLDNDPIYCVITSTQHDNLLNEIQIISRDYNQTPVLVNGKVQSFMGFNFIVCERLGLDGSSYRRIPVFAKSGMHLGIWGDIRTDISERKDLTGLPWQVYATMTCGATRLEEKKVVEIKCSEA